MTMFFKLQQQANSRYKKSNLKKKKILDFMVYNSSPELPRREQDQNSIQDEDLTAI